MISQQYIIDTNFIVRYIVGDVKEQSQFAKSFFKKVIEGKIKAIINDVVVAEVVYVLSTNYKVPRVEIAVFLRNFLIYKGIVLKDKDIILNALDIYQHSKLHIVDSMLAASSAQLGAEVMTFDVALKKYILKN